MGKFKNYIIVIFFLITALYPVTNFAQADLPDTVYANESFATEIRFPYDYTKVDNKNATNPYNFILPNKSVIITANKKNAQTDYLLVTLGGKVYTYIIVYKEVIPGNYLIDLSSPKKFEQHYKDLANGKVIKPDENKNKPPAVDHEKEKRLKEAENNKKYDALIAEAKDLTSQKNYFKARERFQNAVDIKPGDAYAIAQIEKMDNLIREEELRKLQNNSLETYKKSMQNADKAFNQGELASARIFYTEALTSKPGDPIATKRIHEIDDREKQTQKLNDLENSYKAAMSAGDKFLADGDLEYAKIEYNKAYGFIKRAEPQEQIKKINKLISDNAAKTIAENKRIEKEKQDRILAELENNYKNAMSEGDKYLAVGDLENAKLQYNKAYGFIKRAEPQEQIKKINKLINDNAAKALAENKKLEKEKENNSKYQKLIETADTEFKKENYAKAKQLFNSASALKPSEQYPGEMITKIDIALTQIETERKAKSDKEAKEKTTNRLYASAISKGKSYYEKGDLINAKAAYTEANGLKPSEEEPTKQLAVINQKIADAELAKQLNDQYETRVHTGDSVLAVGLKQKSTSILQTALNAFIEASKLKPGEAYPQKQINYIKSETAALESETLKKEARDKLEKENKAYSSAMSRGREAQIAKKYEDALFAYKEAQSIRYNKDVEIIINNIEGYLERTTIKQPTSEKKKKGKKNK